MQNSLGLEKKLKIKTLSLCVNNSLLAVLMVYAWLLYLYSYGTILPICESSIYERLAEKLTDNRYDSLKK